jgi:cyanophycinase
VKLDRLSDITSELSANLVKSIVLPGSLLEWLTHPLPERLRDKIRAAGGAGPRAGEAAEPQRSTVATGPIMLMGGMPVPDESIVAMIHLAGGRSARLAVMPVATENHAEAAELGCKLFTRFGMRGLEVLDLTTRERAESPEWTAKLAACNAVFLVGDSEAIGTDVLQGTLAARTLKEMMAAGKPVAALGAAAAILGDRVTLQRGGQEAVVDGLGLLPGLMVDAHFTQQSRFGRLVKAVNTESGGSLIGVGLDAGCALAIRDGEAKVLGEASVTFLDARDSMVIPDPSTLPPGALGLKVHVLMEGYTMNLRTRKPVGPGSKDTPPHAVGER